MSGKIREVIVVGGILGLLAVGIEFFWVTEEAWPGGPPGTVGDSILSAPDRRGGTEATLEAIERLHEASGR